MKLGFDIDGVFVPDFIVSSDDDVQTMLGARLLLIPLWVPPKDSWLVTSRPGLDRAQTLKLCQELGLDSTRLLMRQSKDVLTEDRAAKYKSGIIFNRSLTHFVESSDYQADEIKQALPTVNVITFRQLVYLGLDAWLSTT